jgi:hypothetical protein
LLIKITAFPTCEFSILSIILLLDKYLNNTKTFIEINNNRKLKYDEITNACALKDPGTTTPKT